MILDPEQTMLYLNCDDAMVIFPLIEAAELYLFNATGKTYDSTNKLAVLYCNVLVSDWYDNRVLMENDKTSQKVRYTLQSILTQLQLGDV